MFLVATFVQLYTNLLYTIQLLKSRHNIYFTINKFTIRHLNKTEHTVSRAATDNEIMEASLR